MTSSDITKTQPRAQHYGIVKVLQRAGVSGHALFVAWLRTGTDFLRSQDITDNLLGEYIRKHNIGCAYYFSMENAWLRIFNKCAKVYY